MNKKTYKTNYKSEIDTFFHEYDQNRSDVPLAKQQEIEKHRPIFERRDEPVDDEPSKIWEGF